METHYEAMKRLTAPHRSDAARLADMGAAVGSPKNVWAQEALLEEYLRREIKTPDQITDPWPLLDLFNAPTSVKLAHQMRREGISLGTITSYLTTAWNVITFERDGEKTFEVSPGLAEHLASTEVKNVPCELLRLPFRSIYVVVPETAGLIIPSRVQRAITAEVREFEHTAEKTDFGGEVKVRGMYLVECVRPDGVRSWNMTVVADGDPTKKNDWTFYTFEQSLPDGATVAEAMKERGVYVSNPEFKRRFRADEVWESYFTWAMNLCLYLTFEPTAQIVEYQHNREWARMERKMKQLHGEARERARKALRQVNPQHRLYVGKDVPRLADAEGQVEARPSRPGHPLTHRVLVTGHWRNQAFGTGWQEHRLLWIRPYLKGPKGLPVENPRRIVT